MHPLLFSPIRIGSVELKNRIAVAPHGTLMARQGVLTDEYIEYQIERAKGGAGLMIMSYGLCDPMGNAGLLIDTWRRENIEGFTAVVSAAHRYDCRVFFQFGESAARCGLAPSALTFPGGGIATAMTNDDIRRMHGNYATCALLLQEAGIDGVELHGHGDLLSDFLSPTINRREDEYGGCLDNRTRYLVEAIDAVRQAVGPEMVVGHRLSVCDGLPGSLGLEEGVQVAAKLAGQTAIDYLSIDTAVEPQLLDEMIAPMYVQSGHELYASRAVKHVVKGLPIIGVGRITTPAQAEKVIEDGDADLVAMARALIADPQWPAKVSEGRISDIRPCLGDNQDCIGRVMQGRPIRCTVNPAVGRERVWGIGRLEAALKVRTVAVVGGGPSGMEAAWVAAARGHRVRLYDRANLLGGSVRLAERLPGRGDMGQILGWHENQLAQHGVEVVLGTTVTPDSEALSAVDAIVVATGACWPKSGFNGLDYTTVDGWAQANVFSLDEAIQSPEQIGRRVIIYDLKGFVEASALAELLRVGERDVHLITPFVILGDRSLSDTLQRRHIMRRISSTVNVLTETRLTSVSPTGVWIEDIISGASRTIDEVDSVVIVSFPSPDDLLLGSTVNATTTLHRIGDCASPGTIGAAIRDGHRVGRLI